MLFTHDTEVNLVFFAALLDTVNNLPLSTTDQAYRYMAAAGVDPAPPTGASPNGLPWGQMMRREFVSTITVRNAN